MIADGIKVAKNREMILACPASLERLELEFRFSKTCVGTPMPVFLLLHQNSQR